MGGYGQRDHRRYRRAVARAFGQVTFYREQCAAAGRVPTEPAPTAIDALPQPPHTLCPFSRPWLPEREPALWTPTLQPLARALRLAGCRDQAPVLEVRESLLDQSRLPSRLRRGASYRVLLSAHASVASPQRRTELNQAALAVAEAAGCGWVVGSPAELAALAPAAGPPLQPVHRLPVAAVAEPPSEAAPVVLHEPALGYLGARVPSCQQFHLDRRRVFARNRDGVVTFSLLRSRRPTLLELVPPGAELIALGRCDRHGDPTLRRREAGG